MIPKASATDTTGVAMAAPVFVSKFKFCYK